MPHSSSLARPPIGAPPLQYSTTRNKLDTIPYQRFFGLLITENTYALGFLTCVMGGKSPSSCRIFSRDIVPLFCNCVICRQQIASRCHPCERVDQVFASVSIKSWSVRVRVCACDREGERACVCLCGARVCVCTCVCVCVFICMCTYTYTV